jgi:GTP-binding protein
MLVDLPGYGFAKVPDRIQQQWAPLIETFFKSRENLCGVIMLVDSRRVQDSDRDMMAWVGQLHIPIMLVATKADKVPRGKRKGAVRELQEGLGVEEEPIFLSAHTGEGKHQVLSQLRDILGT